MKKKHAWQWQRELLKYVCLRIRLFYWLQNLVLGPINKYASLLVKITHVFGLLALAGFLNNLYPKENHHNMLVKEYPYKVNDLLHK